MQKATRGVIAAVLAALAATLACTNGTPPAATAATQEASVPPATVSPSKTPRPTSQPPPTATEDPCVSWDEVTGDMKGKTVCMRGLITQFSQSRQVGTRYQFSDKPNTFFLFSNYWEISNSATGKTVGPGTCVEVTGKVETQGDVPFIHIDDLISGGSEVQGFLLYDDPSACD